MTQDERDITHVTELLLKAAEKVNRQHGDGLGTFLLENLQIGVPSWAGEFGCGGHPVALIALADRRCNFRLCPIYAQGQTVERWMSSPDYLGREREGIGAVVRLARAGQVILPRAPA